MQNMEMGKTLFLGSLVAIVVGLLYAILSAAGMGDYASGTLKTAAFFEGVLWTLLVAGILYGLSAIISSRR